MVEVTCTRCEHSEPLTEEVHPCRTHGEPAHKCELLCPECVNAELAWESAHGLSTAEIRSELKL